MANDFYQYDNDDNNSYSKMVAMCVAAASLVVLGFLVVLYVNGERKKDRTKNEAVVMEETEEEDIMSESNSFTSDELSFWKDLAPNSKKKSLSNKEIDDILDKNQKDKEPAKKDDQQLEDEDADASEITEDEDEQKAITPDELEEYNEGDRENYLAVKDQNGDTKYYEIMPQLGKNDYDLKESLKNENGVLSYKDNKREAVLGVDLSNYNGVIDFKSVKEGGVSFAMLRLGSRGYAQGEITLDDKFVEYAENAALNNIAIGAYFYTQAINESEAVEEANYTVGAVAGFNIKYPIAIYIESVTNDTARTDSLSIKERTQLVKLFCDTVKSYGYTPIIRADRDTLIAGLDLKELVAYDVWLSDSNVPSDYPYNYTVWQYSKLGRVSGITGDVNLDMSFVNYERR